MMHVVAAGSRMGEVAMPKRTNRRDLLVEFGHCDPAQIVYFPNFLTWMDHSTHHLFDSAGIQWRDLPARWGINAPLVDIKARFLAAAGWGDTLHIDSNVESWGTTSFVVSHRITDAATGKGIVEGREVRVCVQIDPTDPKKLTACPVPQDIRSALE